MAEKQEALLSQRPSANSIAQESVPCSTTCLLYGRHKPGYCSLRAPELVETFPGRPCVYDLRDFGRLLEWIKHFETGVNDLREIAEQAHGYVWTALLAKAEQQKGFAEWLGKEAI